MGTKPGNIEGLRAIDLVIDTLVAIEDWHPQETTKQMTIE